MIGEHTSQVQSKFNNIKKSKHGKKAMLLSLVPGLGQIYSKRISFLRLLLIIYICI